MGKAKLNKETYIEWYWLMQRIRKFEERAGMLYGQQKIRGFLHLHIGQEALAAGITSALKQEDNVITAYRDHGMAIAKGMALNAGMAELFGKVTGCSKGKGGSMHFFDVENKFWGGHGIVGAQIGLGAGLAFADKYKETGNVTIAMFGDGAVWQGILHETLNLAMLWSLPVIFVCENNGYAMGTSVERSTKIENIYQLGEAHGMPSISVDGMNPEDVYDKVKQAADFARQGGGPSFLEIKTYRYKGHSMSDPQKYRTKEELKEYKDLDPIAFVKSALLENKWLTEEQLKEIDGKIKQEVDDSVTFAENSPYPDNSEVYKDIYTQEDYPFLID